MGFPFHYDPFLEKSIHINGIFSWDFPWIFHGFPIGFPMGSVPMDSHPIFRRFACRRTFTERGTCGAKDTKLSVLGTERMRPVLRKNRGAGLQYILVNYNISLTWIEAIWGWFPLVAMIPVRSQWGRYNLPIYIYIYITSIIIATSIWPRLKAFDLQAAILGQVPQPGAENRLVRPTFNRFSGWRKGYDYDIYHIWYMYNIVKL